jgi:heme exporter protein C
MLRWGTFAFMTAAVWGAMGYVRPAEGFLYPDGARIILIHVPCAWLSTLAYVVAAWHATVVVLAARGGGVLELSRETMGSRWARADRACEASMELGLLFSVLTTATGSIFSRLQWGAFWSWDPRQTSIVVIMLLFGAYLVLRSAVIEPVVRARLTSAYAVLAVVPGLFLIWVLPRIVSTLHGDANNAVVGGGLDTQYRAVLYGLALPGFLGLYCWLMTLRLRVSRLEVQSAVR